MSPRRRSHRHTTLDIPEKANRILNLILITMLLLTLRIWHLTVVQYDSKVEESRKPQRRVIVEPARRGTIRDRFNVPLAINKVQYQASILYSQFRQIPAIRTETDPEGKRVKRFKRREYIAALSRLLGDELQIAPEHLEDLIHSKGALYYNFPFVIKEDLSEREYYRLKMLEKDWLGLHVQSLPKRSYPKQKIGSDIIGYMGAINRQEYEAIIQEMKALSTYILARKEGFEPALPEGLENPLQAHRRLKDLQERAYTVNDSVGKSGIEGLFEEELRGFQGRKSYYSDSRGNFLRELPGSRDPLSGQRFLLTISAELQEFCEKLLAQNERIRETQITTQKHEKRTLSSNKQPWIKGGSIIAMDPNNGEILALASYPRFDPNDFVTSGHPEIQKQKHSNIIRWFESEEYLAEIWDQKRSLQRERYDDQLEKFYEHEMMMSWENYLTFLLPDKHPIRAGLKQIGTIKNAIELQTHMAELMALSDQNNLYWLLNLLYRNDGAVPYGKQPPIDLKQKLEECFQKNSARLAVLKEQISPYFSPIPQNYDKVLLVDLCRLVVPGERFSKNLIQKVGKQSLASYRDVSASMAMLNPIIKNMTKRLFHEVHFKTWRQQNEKEFLKQKREEEKLASKYPKPFLDYLDQLENTQFQTFWSTHQQQFLLTFLLGKVPPEYPPEFTPYFSHFTTWQREISEGAHPNINWRSAYLKLQNTLAGLDLEETLEYLQTLRSFHELNRPLLGRYRHVRHQHNKQLEKHLAAAFYPVFGYGYGRSQSYRQSSTQGSLFKLVTSYEALVQRYHKLGKNEATAFSLNPLEITDRVEHNGKELLVGYQADGKPIPQLYKKGRLPRSSHYSIGKVDLLRAIETSSNPYFSMLAGDILQDPEDLVKAARLFSYGSRTGIDLPGEIPGKVPEDLSYNRTGLYATAIGQHTLVVTPIQTAVMLSALANGGKVLKPKIVKMTAGAQARSSNQKRHEERIPCPSQFAYQESLSTAGIDFPLFTAVSLNARKKSVNSHETEIKRQLFMPEIIRSILLEGMARVVVKMHQGGLASLSRIYQDYPEAISDYIELKDQLIGKTSTAESMEFLDLDCDQGTSLCTHVWFGGIAFESDEKQREHKIFVFRDRRGEADLVVVVYLRFGCYGKESAPLAAQVVKKWREIKKQNKNNGTAEN